MLRYRPFFAIPFKELHQRHQILFHIHIVVELISRIIIGFGSPLPQRQNISTPPLPGLTTCNSINATVSGRSVGPEIVIIEEAEERVNKHGSHKRELFEPDTFVQVMVRSRRLVPVPIKLPRDLNKTRLGFVHGEEHGIEGIFGCLDLDAVLFMRLPVLRTEQEGVSTDRD